LKTIGLLGGMSWESTLEYYKMINEGIRRRLGGLHSARIAMVSIDFEPIEKFQHQGNWDKMTAMLLNDAKNIEKAGADFLLICTNTMHKIAQDIENSIKIPLLHIADATAEELIKEGIKTVGLLGTAFTMQEEFYKGRLEKKHGLKVVTPDKQDREIIHKIIYNELCLGKIKEDSKKEYLRIINKLEKNGASGVILGCTEIGLLVKQSDTDIKLFDTTKIHAKKAVELALY